MNLKNSLYTIQGVAREGTSVSYELLLNAEHTIYQAHFPNEPITPGVCILQILKELLEEHTGKQYEITKVKNVKFLSILSPAETPIVTFVIDKMSNDVMTGACKVQAHVQSKETLISKISIEAMVIGDE